MYRFFFQHFLRNPKKVGTILPVTKSVAAQFVRHLDMRSDGTPWRILEVAAGTGSITKSLVAHMQEHDKLDVIEIDARCCELLQSKYNEDKRVNVKCMSILDWKPDFQYDFIVSTLPMNSFSPDTIMNVLKHYKKLGNLETICTYVEYIGLEKLKFMFASKDTRKTIALRRKVLSTFRKNHLLEKNKVFTNFIPCYVYHLKLHPTFKPKCKSKCTLESPCAKTQNG